MNLKSKLFGFAAASVFALSMTTGVMAADPVAGGSTDAEVELKVRGNGVCTMTVTEGLIMFSDLSWSDAAWSNDADAEPIEGTVTTGKNKQTCIVQAQSAGVFNTNEDSNGMLLAGQIDLMVDTTRLNGTSYQPVTSNLPTGKWGVDVSLDAADLDDEPGKYEGVIEFQVVSAGA